MIPSSCALWISGSSTPVLGISAVAFQQFNSTESLTETEKKSLSLYVSKDGEEDKDAVHDDT